MMRALSNKDLLEHILSLCEARSLATTLRLVCHEWKRAADAVLLERVWQPLVNPMDLVSHLDVAEWPHPSLLARLAARWRVRDPRAEPSRSTSTTRALLLSIAQAAAATGDSRFCRVELLVKGQMVREERRHSKDTCTVRAKAPWFSLLAMREVSWSASAMPMWRVSVDVDVAGSRYTAQGCGRGSFALRVVQPLHAPTLAAATLELSSDDVCVLLEVPLKAAGFPSFTTSSGPPSKAVPSTVKSPRRLIG